MDASHSLTVGLAALPLVLFTTSSLLGFLMTDGGTILEGGGTWGTGDRTVAGSARGLSSKLTAESGFGAIFNALGELFLLSSSGVADLGFGGG